MPSEPLYPVVNGTKICVRRGCRFTGQPQSLTNFEKNPKLKCGFTGHCKSCSNAKKRKWIAAHREEYRQKARLSATRQRQSQTYRIWYEKNRERLNLETKVWREANPEQVKALYVKRRFRQYGVTPEWYEAQLREQNGQCAICGSSDPKSNGGTFHVDHDHTCCEKECFACDNCRRGLLCAVCNTRLGILEDPDWIEKATAYLSQYSNRESMVPNRKVLI